MPFSPATRRSFRYLALAILFALIAVMAAAGLYLYRHRFVAPQDRAPSAYVKPLPAQDDLSWTSYGGDPGQTRHSAIRQIDPSNVGHLRRAWVYRTGELARRGKWAKEGKFQNTPIIAAGNLVVCTPFNRVIALDPQTGTERWVYDPVCKAWANEPQYAARSGRTDESTSIVHVCLLFMGSVWTSPSRRKRRTRLWFFLFENSGCTLHEPVHLPSHSSLSAIPNPGSWEGVSFPSMGTATPGSLIASRSGTPGSDPSQYSANWASGIAK